MTSRPGQRLPFGFEKPIDHERVTLEVASPGASRCFSVDHIVSGIDRDAKTIIEVNLTSVRNAAGIDRAVSSTQARTSRAFVLTRIVIGPSVSTRPVHGHAREHRLLVRESARGQKKNKSYRCN